MKPRRPGAAGASVAALGSIPLFDELPAGDVARIEAHGEMLEFRTGQVIVQQDEPRDCLYVILQGRVSMECTHPSLRTPMVLADLGPGELAGDLWSVDARAPALIALEATVALRIAGGVVRDVLAQHRRLSLSMQRQLTIGRASTLPR